jgi:hypothetical protein
MMGGLYPDRWEYLLTVAGADDLNRYYQTISLLPVSDITEEAPLAFESLEKLQAMLVDRPDLSGPLMEITEPDQPHAEVFFPLDPLFLGAARTLISSAHYVTLQNGEGVAFVTMYAQDLLPVNNDALFYNVIALANEGQTMVVMRLPIRTESAIDHYEDFDFAFDWETRFRAYMAEQTDMLNALESDDWTPSLDDLDAIVASLYVKDAAFP